MWIDNSKELRTIIMEKYYRYIFNKVIIEDRMIKNHKGITLDIEELAQNYVMAASKAVDKFLVDKGTFKSYLDFWLKDAKTSNSSGHYYGIAFTVSSDDKSIINIAQSLEGLEETDITAQSSNPEENVIKEKETERLYDLAKYADPVGFARESLDLI